MLSQTGQMNHPAIVEMNSTLQKLLTMLEATHEKNKLLEKEVTHLNIKIKKNERRHLKEMEKKTVEITALSESVYKLNSELNIINYAQRQQAQKTQALTDQLNTHTYIHQQPLTKPNENNTYTY
jgi:predicted  nucleic acid-binding Zn-ribbon protein